MKIFILIALLFAVYWYVSCRVEVAKDQRAIVLRLAKFEGVLAQGVHYVVPFTDQAILINLNEHLPAWSSLSEEDINTNVVSNFLADPEKFL